MRDDVRPDRARLRRDESGHDRGARPALAPRDRHARSSSRATACSTRACGTGDLAIIAAKAGANVTGLDFSEQMLERARRKAPRARVGAGRPARAPVRGRRLRRGDRRLRRPQRRRPPGAIAELRRVLRPGGRLGILEITRPRGPLRVFYSLWFDRIVPLLGKVLPGGEAYTYLPASVRRFPGPGRPRRADGRLSRRRRTGSSQAGSSRCTRGRRNDVRAGRDPRRARASTRTSTRSRRGSSARSRRIPGSSPRSARSRSPRAASACGRVLVFLSAPETASRRSRPASRSSCCTWRRSCTTT